MRDLLISDLKFIESSKDQFPFPIADYVDVEVDYERKQWTTFLTKTVNLYGWNKKKEMFDFPEFQTAVNYLCTLETNDTDAKDPRQTIPISDENVMQDHLRNIEIIPFLSAYLDEFVLPFDDSNFKYAFKVWFERLENSSFRRRIMVFRNFFLEGLEYLLSSGHVPFLCYLAVSFNYTVCTVFPNIHSYAIHTYHTHMSCSISSGKKSIISVLIILL